MIKSLEELQSQIRACRICSTNPLGKPLPHEPRPVAVLSDTARIRIIGQAPGTRVHASGRPFTDPSGDRLRQWMGVDEAVFYDAKRIAITPMGFCFPGLDTKGGDLPPRKECASAWQQLVDSAMPQVRLVLLVGQYAQKHYLGAGQSKSVTGTVAGWRHILNCQPGLTTIPLPHPSWRNNAWIKRNPWFEAELVPRLQSEVRKNL